MARIIDRFAAGPSIGELIALWYRPGNGLGSRIKKIRIRDRTVHMPWKACAYGDARVASYANS